MKKIVFFLGCFFGMQLNIFAQWQQVKCPTTSIPFQNITISGNKIYLSNFEDLATYFSNDFGESWFPIVLPQSTNTFTIKGDSIYAGVVGVYLSTDNGINWKKICEPLSSNYGICSIAIIGDNIIISDWFGVLFKYSFIENKWVELKNGLINRSIHKLIVLGNNIYAVNDFGFGGGVFLSTDIGDTWKQVGFNGNEVLSIALLDNYLFAATRNGGIYFSANNSNAWTARNKGLNCDLINTLFVSEKNIYAGTDSGVFKSVNYGADWSKLDSNFFSSSIGVIGNNIFATSSEGVLYSNNNGKNWSKIYLQYPSYAMAVSKNNIYVGTYSDGLFISSNNGQTWSSLNNLNNSIERLNYSAITNSGNNIFASVCHISCPECLTDITYCKSYLSSDEGKTWSSITHGVYSALELSANNFLISDGSSRGIFIYNQVEDSWQKIDRGLPSNTYIYTLIEHDNNVFIGTNTGIYVSNNAFEDWVKMDSGISQQVWINSLAIYSNSIFAGTSNGLYFSESNGVSWVKVSNNLPFDVAVNSVTIAGNTILLGTDSGVFISKDAGINWNSFNSGLSSQIKVNDLEINDNYIYASTNCAGIWKRSLSEILTSENIIKNQLSSSLYPNPSKGLFQFTSPTSFSNNSQLEVFDFTGRQIITQTLPPAKQAETVTIDLNNQPAGIYLVRLKVGSEEYSGKVLLVK